MQIVALTPRRIAVVIGTTLTALAVFAQTASAGVVFPDSGVSPNAKTAIGLFTILMIVGVIVVLAVVIALLRGLRRGGDAPADHSHAYMITGVAAFVVLVVVGSIAYHSTATPDPSKVNFVSPGYQPFAANDPQNPVYPLRNPRDLTPPKGKYLQVFVNGQQYVWRYGYPYPSRVTAVSSQPLLYAYRLLVVPVGVTVLLNVTSSDVVHSWWVPRVAGKIDAVPGYVNHGWFRIDKAGIYRGASTEISGPNYPSMVTSIRAVSLPVYNAYIARLAGDLTDSYAALAAARRVAAAKAPKVVFPSKTATGGEAAPAAPAPAPAAKPKPAAGNVKAQGAAIFTSAGCAGCHTLAAANANGKVGPDLDGIGSKSAAILHQDIVDPNAKITKGFKKNVMPATFGKTLTPAQLATLIKFLQQFAK